jgi:hypothetical protein
MMKRVRYRGGFMLSLFLLITLLVQCFPLGSEPLIGSVDAQEKEFEYTRVDDNITIPVGNFASLNLDLREPKEYEIIFTVQVKEGLPIDIWFVNEDNYMLLTSDVYFLYYVDGTSQEVSYTRNIVTIDEPDIYYLVLTNYYNNQSVDVNLIYETRTYLEQTGETTSEDNVPFLISLIIVIAILIILLIVLLIKNRQYKKAAAKASKKLPSKKKMKQKKRKPKKAKKKVSEKTESKKEDALWKGSNYTILHKLWS